MADRPVIGITGSNSRFPIAWWATKFAVKMAGGIPIRLTPKNFKKHKKEYFQGIIIGGGSDIQPSLYKEDDESATMLDIERDAFEIKMIEHALDANTPILGICRGAQLINIVLKGTLYLDISKIRKHTSNRRTIFPTKQAFIEDDSILLGITGSNKIKINSLHHQAIHKLGEGLKAVAKDKDDIIQAIEHPKHRFLIGVQWHPEYLTYMSRQFNIIKSLVNKAASIIPRKL